VTKLGNELHSVSDRLSAASQELRQITTTSPRHQREILKWLCSLNEIITRMDEVT